MSRQDQYPPNGAVRADQAGDWRWARLILEALPLPALVVETSTNQVRAKNPASSVLPSQNSTRIAVGAVVVPGFDDFMARLVTDAAGEGGVTVAWQTQYAQLRYQAYSRVLPTRGDETSLVLLTFIDLAVQEAAGAELREALAARDEFFSVATHELKDPLFSIQLSLQLLRYASDKVGEVPAHVAHHLDVAGRQADRLSRIIDNLLDVSRIRGNRLQIDAETFDLAEHAREVAGRFEETARSERTVLTVQDGEPVIGYFDRLKIDQVLSNLLTNALKYGCGKPVTVRVYADGDAAILEVEDHGPGVAPADQGRIFGRFERASDGHKKDSLGLGLYIVRSIAEAHGGTAAVRSEVGRGATFTVTLPRNRIHHREAAEDTQDRNTGEKG